MTGARSEGLDRKVGIYLAGPLFSEAEIRWGFQVKAAIEGHFGDSLVLIWPHEIGSDKTQMDIFKKNLDALQRCSILVALLDGPQVDDGTAWEIGYHYARGGVAVGLRTDFRRAGESAGAKVNAMVEGACMYIAHDMEELLRVLEELLSAHYG